MARKKELTDEEKAERRKLRRARRATRLKTRRIWVAKQTAHMREFIATVKWAQVRKTAKTLILSQAATEKDLPGQLKREAVINGVLQELDKAATFPLWNGWGLLLEVGTDHAIRRFRVALEDLVDDVYDELYETGELDTAEA